MFDRWKILLPDIWHLREDLTDYLWTIPDRFWLALTVGGENARKESQEKLFLQSLDYLRLSPKQLSSCQIMFGKPFLTSILDNVYAPLLASGRFSPFPVVVYLTIGYTHEQVDILIDPTRKVESQDFPVVLYSFLNSINRWLAEILKYEYRTSPFNSNSSNSDSSRFDWIQINQFIRRAVSLKEIGIRADHLRFDTDICSSLTVRNSLWSEDGNGIETLLEKGVYKVIHHHRVNPWEDFLITTQKQIENNLPQEKQFSTNEEELQYRARQQQARAVRFYLGRSGVRYEQNLNERNGENFNTHERDLKEYTKPTTKTHAFEQVLDFQALAGYQAFGKFLPDDRTRLLLDLLRRRMLDTNVIQQTRENTIEGITRKGNFSQILRWQLALRDKKLPDAMQNIHVYDRFLNNHMLYLKRVSERSQEMAITFLVVIDLSADSNRSDPGGRRWHSIVREICAHLLQDAYQILWRVPRLYADAVIVLHDGNNVVWKSALTLSEGDGQNPSAEDLFLKPIPAWNSTSSETADPAAYFQFLLPSFLYSRKEIDVPNNHSKDISSQIVEFVTEVRQKRIHWLRGMGTNAGSISGGLLPSADLLVTVLTSPGPSETSDQPGTEYEIFYNLGLIQHFWMCDFSKGHIRFRIAQDGEYFKEYSSTLDSFEWQQPDKTSSQSIGLRQAFIRETLDGLLAICNGIEVNV